MHARKAIVILHRQVAKQNVNKGGRNTAGRKSVRHWRGGKVGETAGRKSDMERKKGGRNNRKEVSET